MSWSKEENIKNAALWLSSKIKLIEDKHLLLEKQKQTQINTGVKPPLRIIYRGGVYWVDFGSGNLGAEKNKTRPALIISANHLNKAETVLVIPISSKFKYKLDSHGNKIPLYKNHFVLDNKKYPQLSEQSAVKCEDTKLLMSYE